MSLSVGIIGLPNVGKSTLFNALTRCGAEATNYPFCTIDRNVGIADVPDDRLDRLRQILSPGECQPTVVRFVDVAGLVEGAHKGEGLGNRFLAHIRETDALLHVIRCFADDNVSHAYGGMDPLRDAGVVDLELALADLDVLERAGEGLRKRARTEPKQYGAQLELLDRLRNHLVGGNPLRDLTLAPREESAVREYGLLTLKPVLYGANVSEDDLVAGGGPACDTLRLAVGPERVLPVSARIEAELLDLTDGERAEYSRALGLEASGVQRLVEACHRLLGLITFYTTAHDKLRAWSVPSGTTAPAAAGRIHSDMEQGFIRAEVVSYNDLVEAGSMEALRQQGAVRVEGKDYVVRDLDVMHFLFRT